MLALKTTSAYLYLTWFSSRVLTSYELTWLSRPSYKTRSIIAMISYFQHKATVITWLAWVSFSEITSTREFVYLFNVHKVSLFTQTIICFMEMKLSGGIVPKTFAFSPSERNTQAPTHKRHLITLVPSHNNDRVPLVTTCDNVGFIIISYVRIFLGSGSFCRN